MALSIYIWLAIVAALVVARFFWKAIKKGITVVLVLVVGIWLFRALIPAGWDHLTSYVQASLGNILRH